MHPHVAMSLNNLAYTLGEQGDHERSLELMHRALEIRQSVWGPDHPKVGEMYNNIATTLRALNRLADSRTNYEQALRIKEAALGHDAVDLAIPINNLASVLRKLEDYESAESLYRRALKLREDAFGPEHQKVGNTLNNLAMLYFVQRDFERSLELYERATSVWAASLGDEHPRVAHGQTGWGKTLLELGRYAQALPLLEEALRRREANSRTPKKHLADTRFALARALWKAPPHLGRDRRRALDLAESARAGFEGLAAGDRHKYDEVVAWLVEHR
jgi:tetratricopeptide (TPR) repeat protein